MSFPNSLFLGRVSNPRATLLPSWPEVESCGFLIVGSPAEVSQMLSKNIQTLHPGRACYETDARTAELCKYMENCFLVSAAQSHFESVFGLVLFGCVFVNPLRYL
jgi:hypothetical protein